jgi:hypothetical protein
MKRRATVLWIAMIAMLMACSLFSLQTGTTELNGRTYVTGIWVPTERTLEFMGKLGYQFSHHSIQFFNDGGVRFTNIPSRWIFPGETASMALYSGLGTWSLDGPMNMTLDDVKPLGHVTSSAGEDAIVRFGTVLDLMEFVPLILPKDMNWATFQKCYPHLHISDPKLKPFVEALNTSKRESLGFSPITDQDRIEIDGAIGTGDIRLNAYNELSSHNIQFKRTGNGYVWIFEQESFTGPEKWVDSDAATWEETIMLQYQTEQIDGGPVNDLMVDYTGHDPRLTNHSQNWYLSNNVQVVQPVLDEWRAWRAKQPPSPESLCP